jgi:hypothetical protein
MVEGHDVRLAPDQSSVLAPVADLAAPLSEAFQIGGYLTRDPEGLPGFVLPVVSGVKFNLTALTNDPIRLLELPLFLGMFLIVRGTPALLLYRGVLNFRDRVTLAVFSATGLPLIVAITTIAVEEGHMRSATAASLVGAGILSTAILPVVGLRLRAGAPREDEPDPALDERAAVAGA